MVHDSQHSVDEYWVSKMLPYSKYCSTFIMYPHLIQPSSYLEMALVQSVTLGSLQSLSRVQHFATSWTAAGQASPSFTISWSLLKLVFIELVMLMFHVLVFWQRGMRDLRSPPGIESTPLALEGEVSTPGPPEKSPVYFFHWDFWFTENVSLICRYCSFIWICISSSLCFISEPD